jgi:hypothetical protein
MHTIAIQPDNQLLMSGRYQSFSARWIEQLQQAGHEVRCIDAFQPNLYDQLDNCSGFMWWFAHLPFPRNFAKRLLPSIEHGLGIPVFPTWKTIWHFDDKIAQNYLLQLADIPIPQTWVFWHRKQALEFCRNACYPLVIKLTSGIVSENVALLNNVAEAEYWIRRLFSSGTVDLKQPHLRPHAVYGRLRTALKILLTGEPPNLGARTDLQKGYLLIQEFLPDNRFDTRITVIGNRAFGFRRFNRPNDFRASGSGEIDWDREQIDLETVRLAFWVAQHLQTQSIAIDCLRRGDEYVVNEISYYYEGWALHACPGHWKLYGDVKTGQLEWVEGQMQPEDAILEDFLDRLKVRSDE